jgi:hypothetical protein
MNRSFRALLMNVSAACALLVGASLAHAVVTQPNGAVVPETSAKGRLEGYLNGSAANNNIDEMVDSQRDAQIQPEKFSPLCDFSGRYVAKGGGANFAIGWYNVDDNRMSNNPPRYVPTDLAGGLNTPAANSEIFILFPFSGALPPANMLDLTASSIRMSPNYLGGLIGFALIPNPNGTGNANATQYHYTESRFNTYCALCSSPGYWISTLIYKSNQLANTFYLGFEDLDFLNAAGNAGVNGNDLDYEDFLFRFSGIACVGAGQPCTVSTNQGACQIGVTDCDAQGTIICKAITGPSVELCDGIDNNCDGNVDNGATCPAGQVCDRGRCSTSCSSEFPCGNGLSCDEGRCIDSACVGVSCPATQVCRLGTCSDACAGIVCPEPGICSGGSCIDPCVDPATGAPLECRDGSGNIDPKKVCVGGACITTCDCLPCAAGKACQTSTGKCVEPGCVNITCPAGDQCKGGVCAPACDGAMCPPGQECRAGKCSLPCDGKCGPAEECKNNKCVPSCVGVFCEGDLTCVEGKCVVACDASLACPGGLTCQDGVCISSGSFATGCSCRMGSNDNATDTVSHSGALAATLLLLGWGLVRARRRALRA